MEFTNFDSLKSEFPPLPNSRFALTAPQETQPYDLYILTGSHSGAYEELQWIRDLEAWIRRADELKVPLLGICFGHQVIATALGGAVTMNPKGWEIGAHSFTLNASGQDVFKGRKSLHLQYTHQDIVSQVPGSLSNLGGNDKTDCQAMCKDSHIITLQGHPEFSQSTLEALLHRKLKSGIIDEPSFEVYIKSLQEPLDNDFVACACLSYLKLHPSLE